MNIISCVQFCPRLAACPADVSDNLRRTEPLLQQAYRVGSQLIVFPELAFTGYSFLTKDEAAAVSEPSDGPTFRAMRAVAAELKAYVAWGYVEAGDGRLHNSCSLVGPDGTLLSSYRKINLWGNDFLWASPGREPAPIVQTELGRTSVIICRDLRDKIPTNIPVMASKKPQPFWKAQKVDVVAACLNWGKGGFPSPTWMDFAADNECTVAVANRWGVEENGTFKQSFGQGGSCVIRSDWTVHTSGLAFNQDCVVTAAFP